ncbi:MAG: glycine cleavage system protein T [Phycisphaerae bacterium]|nr:glycine cleavage system protein T [Phycisphaerae bacterium]
MAKSPQPTPIHDFHVSQGAQLVDYAGWSLPMKYEGVTAEHHQVRRSAGMFDVSHMGRLQIKGLHARRLLERVCTRRIGTMEQGQCRYTLICNETGGVRDDVIVYRMDDDEFMVVVNAANRSKIVEHMGSVVANLGLKVSVEDRTEKTAMVAAQGPRVMELISKVSSEIPTLKRYRFTVKNFLVMKLIVSRTGYTGEDGLEVILPANMVSMAMKLLMKDIDPKDPNAIMKPAGLGARDTLRIEAGMPLYGHELGEDINALACGVDFAISLDKNVDEDGVTFIGQEALIETRESGGPPRVLAGLKIDGRRTARQGMPVVDATGATVGVVTSGCVSPTLDASIAMAFLDRGVSEGGGALEVDTGRAKLAASLTPLPFYKAPKK